MKILETTDTEAAPWQSAKTKAHLLTTLYYSRRLGKPEVYKQAGCTNKIPLVPSPSQQQQSGFRKSTFSAHTYCRQRIYLGKDAVKWLNAGC
jgi:hypothetical protein